MIATRFHFITSLANTDKNEFIGLFDLPETPMVGETLNIDGNPYVIHKKGWASGSNNQRRLLCYIDVISANHVDN